MSSFLTEIKVEESCLLIHAFAYSFVDIYSLIPTNEYANA